MAYHKSSAIINGRPNLISRMNRWISDRTAVQTGGFGESLYSFVLPPRGYMIQTIPSSRIGGVTPKDFKLSLISRISEVVDGDIIRAKLEIDFNYTDGTSDTFLYPLLLRSLEWTSTEDVLTVLDSGKRLQSVDVQIYNDSPIVIRVAQIYLYPNEESWEGNESSQQPDPDKMILYGLEADLPILR